jgi:hypothetical protein
MIFWLNDRSILSTGCQYLSLGSTVDFGIRDDLGDQQGFLGMLFGLARRSPEICGVKSMNSIGQGCIPWGFWDWQMLKSLFHQKLEY